MPKTASGLAGSLPCDSEQALEDRWSGTKQCGHRTARFKLANTSTHTHACTCVYALNVSPDASADGTQPTLTSSAHCRHTLNALCHHGVVQVRAARKIFDPDNQTRSCDCSAWLQQAAWAVSPRHILGMPSHGNRLLGLGLRHCEPSAGTHTTIVYHALFRRNIVPHTASEVRGEILESQGHHKLLFEP